MSLRYSQNSRDHKDRFPEYKYISIWNTVSPELKRKVTFFITFTFL